MCVNSHINNEQKKRRGKTRGKNRTKQKRKEKELMNKQAQTHTRISTFHCAMPMYRME